jgi:hypothetical protein
MVLYLTDLLINRYMKKLAFLLLIPLHLFAQRSVIITSMAQPPSTGPYGTLSASSFTVPSTVTGTGGSNYTLYYTLANQATSTGTFSFPSGFQVNVNGAGATTTSPVTGLGNCSVCSILINLPASDATGTYSGSFTLTPAGGTAVTATGSGTVTATAPYDSMRVQMVLTTSLEVSGWSHCVGDPSTTTLSVTGGNNNTIVYSTLNPSQYGQLGGVGIGASNGQPTTTTWNYAQGVLAEDVQNANTIDTTKHLAQFSGLLAGHTYTVALAGVFTSAYNYALVGAYDVAGTSWGTIQTQDCNSNNNPNPAQLTFNVTAPANGIVTISWGRSNSSQIAGAFGAITIKQTD